VLPRVALLPRAEPKRRHKAGVGQNAEHTTICLNIDWSK
jgi:hypothetical protein